MVCHNNSIGSHQEKEQIMSNFNKTAIQTIDMHITLIDQQITRDLVVLLGKVALEVLKEDHDKLREVKSHLEWLKHNLITGFFSSKSEVAYWVEMLKPIEKQYSWELFTGIVATL